MEEILGSENYLPYKMQNIGLNRKFFYYASAHPWNKAHSPAPEMR